MRKVVIRQPKEDTLFTDQLDDSGRFVVRLDELDPLDSYVLRRIGRGTAHLDHYYTWVKLISEFLSLSTEPKKYDESKLFRSKKEAVESSLNLSGSNANIVCFNSERAFKEYLKEFYDTGRV